MTPLNEEGVRLLVGKLVTAARDQEWQAHFGSKWEESTRKVDTAGDAIVRAYLALSEQVGVMREALAPFADYVAVDPADPDVSLADLEGHSLLTKDFRAARAALTPTPE